MPGRFVELPLGATEERVTGTLDLDTALRDGRVAFAPGLLARAHEGVLYVDEVNLLADALVDLLLDAAATGTQRRRARRRVATHPARFVLVGTMNPDEGELRPQLIDRFGLAVEVHAPHAVADRVAAVQAQLEHDAVRSGTTATPDLDPADLDPADLELAQRLATRAHAGAVDLPDGIVEAAAELALAVDAQGLRADLTMCRAAVAHARWQRRTIATTADLRVVAPLVLAHRRRRNPFDQHHDQRDLDNALDEALGPEPAPAPPSAPAEADRGHGSADVDPENEPGQAPPAAQEPPQDPSNGSGQHDRAPSTASGELRSALGNRPARTDASVAGGRDVARARHQVATSATNRPRSTPRHSPRHPPRRGWPCAG